MNKKVLVMAVALMVVAMLVTPMVGLVHAGKGQTKQDFELYLTGKIGEPEEGTEDWTTKNGVWQVRGLPYFADYIMVTVGVAPYYPEPSKYRCTMDRTINLVTGLGAIRISESIVFADGGTLEIQTAETISGFGTSEYSVEGSFVGHGTGSLEGVKVQGITWRESSGVHYRIGTVMGWHD